MDNQDQVELTSTVTIHNDDNGAKQEEDENEFGFDDELEYDEELERALIAAETSVVLAVELNNSNNATTVGNENIEHEQVVQQALQEKDYSKEQEDHEEEEVEEEDKRSLFEKFRKKGFLSVSDLVGPIWCETQYDYRLRTLPFLPPSQRPSVITSSKGKEIAVDVVKVNDKDKILRRGEKIHKRLEREIHPKEVLVSTTTREDVWGLRFLNMLSAVEALLTLGKCRELPVVGFTNGIMIMGVIDEITRQPINDQPSKPETRSTRQTQTALTSFFSPSPSKAKTKVIELPRTHKLFVSDSKTRASGTLPREGDTLAGRLQVMMYKEMLDAILLAEVVPSPSPSTSKSESESQSKSKSNLPSRNGFSWNEIFDHLQLDSTISFSDAFLLQSQSIIIGNGLRFGVDNAKNLNDMCQVWRIYVQQLGLGTPSSISTATKSKGKIPKGKDKESEDRNIGRTEDLLELVYRRAGPKKNKKVGEKVQRRRRKRRRDTDVEVPLVVEGEPPPTISLFSQVLNFNKQNENEHGEVVNVEELDMDMEDEEERLIQLAIAESLIAQTAAVPVSINLTGTSIEIEVDNSGNEIERPPTRASERVYWQTVKEGRDSEDEREEDELAWAVEMSLGSGINGIEEEEEVGEKVVSTNLNLLSSQPIPGDDTLLPSEEVIFPLSEETPPAPMPRTTAHQSLGSGSGSGSIIGRTRFQHSPTLLSAHIESVLQFWMGQRPPAGVEIEDARRCGWCEFEDGCEWRQKKAEELWKSKRR